MACHHGRGLVWCEGTKRYDTAASGQAAPTHEKLPMSNTTGPYSLETEMWLPSKSRTGPWIVNSPDFEVKRTWSVSAIAIDAQNAAHAPSNHFVISIPSPRTICGRLWRLGIDFSTPESGFCQNIVPVCLQNLGHLRRDRG